VKLRIVLFLFALTGPIFAQTVDERPPNIDLDRIYGLSTTKGRQALDMFFAFLSNTQINGVIDIQFKAGLDRRERIDRIRRILKHIKYRKFDMKRLSFRLSEGGEDILTLFEENLLVDDKDHVIVRASEIEKRFRTLFPKE